MTTPQPDNGVLVLYPARIALATDGVISDPAPPAGVPVQGVPLDIFKEALRGNGTLAAAVQVLVDPPMDAGQYVEITLWINGVQSGVPQEVGNQIMTFSLFQSELRDGAINVIQYKLKNHAGNISESVELWALYSETLPGGNDVPGTAEHPALLISLPAELGDPANIGKDEVDQGVLLTFDYPYRKAHDLVTYEINRERFEYKVKPADVDKPFSALVDRAQFEQVGSLENCPFSYTVVDQLGNTTHKRRWSKIIRANIDIDAVTLDKPILREDPDDDMDDPQIVDLDKLQGRPLLVVIIPQAPMFQKDDDVWVTYRSSESGADLKIPGKITANFGVLQPCIVEVPNDQIIADSSVTVTFELFRPNGNSVGKSRTASATVIGTRVELEPPTIKEAPNGILQPIAAKDTLTAVIPAYENMIGTQVSVTWSGTPGEGSATEGPFNVTAQADKDIPLPVTVVAFNLGKPVKVTYIVIRNGAPQDSKALPLTVLSIADGDRNLPSPAIDGAVGDELDVTQLEEGAQLRIEKWMLQAVGQCIWLCYNGTDKNGYAVEKVFWAGEAHRQVEGLVTAAQVAWLQELKDGLPLTITFRVNFDKVANADTAIEFPVRTYTVKATATPELEIDPTPMELDGANIYLAAAPYTPPLDKTAFIAPNAFNTRIAKGGTPPYSYSSSNSNVASVAPATGYVFSTGNGFATISVHDMTGKNASYTVKCKNVYELVCIQRPLSHAQAKAEMASIGAQFFTLVDDLNMYRDVHVIFQKLNPPSTHYWITTVRNPEGYDYYAQASGREARWDPPPRIVGLDIRTAYSSEVNHSLGYRPRQAPTF